MQDNQSNKLTSRIDDPNRLAPLTCPACSAKHETPGRCSCGQVIDASEHQSDQLAKREKSMVRRVKAKESRSFLDALVNQDAQLVTRRFKGKGFLPPEFPVDGYSSRLLLPHLPMGWDAYFEGPKETNLRDLEHLQKGLREIWGSSDRERVAWRIVSLRRMARRLTVHPSVDNQVLNQLLDRDCPPRDALQEVLVYFQEHSHVARKCANGQCGQTPYFFAETPNQKYCSDTCSYAKRSEAKTLWWHTKGSDWRKSRAQKGRKSHGTK